MARSYSAGEGNILPKGWYRPLKYSISEENPVFVAKSSEDKFERLPDDLKKEVAMASQKSKFVENGRVNGGFDKNQYSYAFIQSVDVAGAKSHEAKMARDEFAEKISTAHKDAFVKMLEGQNAHGLLQVHGDGLIKTLREAMNQAIGRAMQGGHTSTGTAIVALGGALRSRYADDSAYLITISATNQGGGNSDFSVSAKLDEFNMVNKERHYLD